MQSLYIGDCFIRVYQSNVLAATSQNSVAYVMQNVIEILMVLKIANFSNEIDFTNGAHPTISISMFRNAYNSVSTPLLPHLITLIAIYYHPLNPTVT